MTRDVVRHHVRWISRRQSSRCA